MKMSLKWTSYTLSTLLLFSSMYGVEKSSEKNLPEDMQKIMNQPKYEHAIWGLYAKDLQTGKVLYDLNSNELFSPASTTKLFTIAALLHTFGDDYRFKTPVYATSEIKDGKLQGDLILVGQGDLTFGGRQPNADTIAYTKLDHTIANEVPGAILTPENPLHGLNELAKQIYQKGLREIFGNILIDDRLFETVEKRGSILSPTIINENVIDMVLNPSSVGELAKFTWRPEVPGYKVDNQVKTVEKDAALDIQITSDDTGHNIILKGSLPAGQKDLVRTFSIKDPKAFARAAFIQALQQAGITVNASSKEASEQLPSNYKDLPLVALWTSPPLTEYADLILKVSHNLGANLTPLLLAAHEGKTSFDEGIRLIGDFAIQNVKLSPNEFVFIDGAGGNDNRLTPKAEVQLLEYVHNLTPSQFKHYVAALPILGVDGSLEDFARKSPGAGKVESKPGTGVAFNTATGKFFLITQALGGYIEGKNGHIYAYMLAVNNGEMPTIDDIFAIFEDVSQLSSMIYSNTGQGE